MHIGRSWTGTALEDDCPCPKADCGLVISEEAVEECPQHAISAAKSLRQLHWDENCPEKR